MAKKASRYFIIGLFVTIGSLSALALIVWLGASRYFQKGTTYITYFDESVQGLQVDSAVKYRGVEVGNVEKIRVAPDNNLIGVVMKIKLRENLEKDTFAQLKSAGITGIVYVELDRRVPGAPDLSPRVTFASEYPIIPSKPSQIKQIFAQVEGLLEKVREIDFKGISERLKKLMRSTEVTFAGPRMNSVIMNLDTVTARTDKTVEEVNRLLTDGRVDDIIDEAKGTVADARTQLNTVMEEMQATLADARTLVGTAEKELIAMKLPEIGGNVNRLVEGNDRKARLILQELASTSDNLQQASETLDQLIKKVRTTPSELIFSQPPAPKRNE